MSKYNEVSSLPVMHELFFCFCFIYFFLRYSLPINKIIFCENIELQKIKSVFSIFDDTGTEIVYSEIPQATGLLIQISVL